MRLNKILQAAGILWVCLIFLSLGWMVTNGQAQSSTPHADYSLNVQRSFGFSSGSQIRGVFSAEVIGNGPVKVVTFLIDGKTMGQVTQAPYKINFNTSDFPLGWHDLTAAVQTQDNQNITTPARRFEFVSAAAETAAVRNIILPLVGGIALVFFIVVGGQALIFRNRPLSNLALGTPRNYGIRGGAVCPRCHRPFPLHWWALNMGIGTKYDRCDFCGRSGFFRLTSLNNLRKAEAAELEMTGASGPVLPEDEKTKLDKLLDESRYTDDH